MMPSTNPLSPPSLIHVVAESGADALCPERFHSVQGGARVDPHGELAAAAELLVHLDLLGGGVVVDAW